MLVVENSLDGEDTLGLRKTRAIDNLAHTGRASSLAQRKSGRRGVSHNVTAADD